MNVYKAANTSRAGPRPRGIASASGPLPPWRDGGVTHRIVVGPVGGEDALPSLDPFVGLADDMIPPTAGFGMHPHRGIEIVTYLWEGGLAHEDSAGNGATVRAGGAERITTGRGVAHAEFPTGPDDTLGLQLWLALSEADRQLDPSFQLLAPEEVPSVEVEGARVRVVAGQALGARSPLVVRQELLYLDVTLAPGRSFSQAVPAAWNGFIYVLAGGGAFGSPAVAAGAHQRLVLGAGDEVTATAAAGEPLRFVLLAGLPVRGGRR